MVKEFQRFVAKLNFQLQKKILRSARESVCVDSGTRTKAAITKSCPSAWEGRLDKTFVMKVDVFSIYNLHCKLQTHFCVGFCKITLDDDRKKSIWYLWLTMKISNFQIQNYGQTVCHTGVFLWMSMNVAWMTRRGNLIEMSRCWAGRGLSLQASQLSALVMCNALKDKIVNMQLLSSPLV